VIPQSFIEELLARVDVVEVVGAHVRLKKSGANFSGICPFHAEKTPSFTVSATKQFYHCFGCSAHGTAIGFLMEHLGLSYVDAVEELSRRFGLTVPREGAHARSLTDRSGKQALHEVLEAAMLYYRRRLKESERAIAYLKGRGVEGRTASLFALGYAPRGWNALQAAIADYAGSLVVEAGLVVESPPEASAQSTADGDPPGQAARRWDRFRDRVIFPIRNPSGQVLGFGGRTLDQGEPKYLNSPETSLFSKGRELYGLFEARDGLRRENAALVVEGYMDVVMLAQHGIDFAVATLGTAVTPDHLVKLLRRVDRIVFAFDGDAAGRKAAWKALELSLPLALDGKRFEFLFLPKEHDPDSFVRAYGLEGLRAAIQQSDPLSRVLIRELVERYRHESAEDRAALLAAALRYLGMLPAAGLRIQIAREVAELTGVTVHELNQLLKQPALHRYSQRTTSPADATPARTPRSPQRKPPRGPAAGLPEKTVITILAYPQLLRRLRAQETLGEFAEFVPTDLEALLNGLEQSAFGSGAWSDPEGSVQAGSSETSAAHEKRHASIGQRLDLLCAADPDLWNGWRTRLQSGLGLVAVLEEEEAWVELQGALRQILDRSIRDTIDRLAEGGLSSPKARDRYAYLSFRQQALRISGRAHGNR
jgi:DNA primase